MINSKIIVGKDSISKLNYEGFYNECKSILIIYDMLSEINSTKSKIKKAFGKDIKITFFKVKSLEYANTEIVDSCLKVLKDISADLIICAGTQISHNVGKAVKYILNCNMNSFGDVCDKKEDIKNLEQNNDIKLIFITDASGNHQQILTGYFEILDNKSNTLYRFNKQCTIPYAVLVDEKVLDKLSNTAKLGIRIASLIMGLIVITNVVKEQDKIAAMTAMDICFDENSNLSNLLTAEMYAGYDFLNLKDNVLNEFILSAIDETGEIYSLILLLTMKKSIKNLVSSLSAEDIKLLGLPFNIENVQNDDDWREKFAGIIENKLKIYFDDKDIPKKLNEIGLNSKQIEDIFEELNSSLGYSENLAKLKDICYINY